MHGLNQPCTNVYQWVHFFETQFPQVLMFSRNNVHIQWEHWLTKSFMVVMAITLRFKSLVNCFLQFAVFSVCCFTYLHVRTKRATNTTKEPTLQFALLLGILSDYEYLIFLGNLKTNAFTLPYIMLKNGQTYFGNLMLHTPQDF